MAFFDKLNDFAKNLGDKTSDAIETGKQNAKIHQERSAAEEELKIIGRYYYDLFAAGEEIPEAVAENFAGAKAHFEAAAQAQAEIARIKAENEAAKAAAQAEAEAARARAKAEMEQARAEAEAARASAQAQAAAQVQAVTPAGSQTAFGQSQPVNPPAGIVCPSCGANLQPGMRFCNQCGQKMEE